MDNLTLPPASNTGGKFTKALEVGIDWLSCTFRSAELERVKQVVESTFQESFAPHDRGIINYETSWRSPLGIVLATQPRGDCGSRDSYLSIPGAACGSVTLHRLVALMMSLGSLGAKGTRLDVKADDYTKTLDLQVISQAAELGQFSGFRSGRYIKSFGDDRRKGHTVEFGRRGSKAGSGRFIRIYDKAAESQGEIDAIRVECELSGQVAASAWQIIGILGEQSDDKYAHLLHSLLVGSIDFIERTDKNLERCDRLAWWQWFCDDVEGVRLTAARTVTTLRRKMATFAKQYRCMLAVFANAFETCQEFDNWWSLLMAEGEKGLTDKHWALIDVGKRELSQFTH